jgi:hypothetical protein
LVAASARGIHQRESMNNLADLGERMGADPASWSDKPHLRILKRPAARTVRAQC